MARSITDEEICRAAVLAKLTLPSEELPTTRADLADMLTAIDALRLADTSGIEALHSIDTRARGPRADLPCVRSAKTELPSAVIQRAAVLPQTDWKRAVIEPTHTDSHDEQRPQEGVS